MISKELRKIIDTIRTQGEMHYLDAVTEKQIVDFEEKHGIKLPTKYREWFFF